MRITSKGQVTIPQNVREQMGFLANTEVEFFISGNKVFLKKANNSEGRGKQYFSQVNVFSSIVAKVGEKGRRCPISILAHMRRSEA
jgi:AbrB family looped-hinge helix DNA binding protein